MIDCSIKNGKFLSENGNSVGEIEQEKYDPFLKNSDEKIKMQNPEIYFSAVKKLLQNLIKKNGIQNSDLTISFTTIRDSWTCVGENGKILSDTHLYFNENSVGENFWGKIKFAFQKASILSFVPGVAQKINSAAPNIFAEKNSKIWAETEKICSLSALILHHFSGKFLDAPDSAIGKIPFNFKTQKWAEKTEIARDFLKKYFSKFSKKCPKFLAEKIFSIANFVAKNVDLIISLANENITAEIFPVEKEKLVELVPVGTIVENISDAVRNILPKKTKFVVGTSDKNAAMVGAGISEKKIGVDAGTLISVAAIFSEFTKIGFDPAFPFPNKNFPFLMEQSIKNGMIRVSEFLQKNSAKILEKMGGEKKSEKEILNFLNENILENEKIFAEFKNLLEKIANEIAKKIKKLRKKNPQIEKIVIGGGGSKSDFLCEKIREKTGLEIEKNSGAENAGLRGAIEIARAAVEKK